MDAEFEINWKCHLLARADGIVLTSEQKAARYESGRGVPIGISPAGVLWFCYYQEAEDIMRRNLDSLWRNVLKREPSSGYGAR